VVFANGGRERTSVMPDETKIEKRRPIPPGT
jgi:hypothetical protein